MAAASSNTVQLALDLLEQVFLSLSFLLLSRQLYSSIATGTEIVWFYIWLGPAWQRSGLRVSSGGTRSRRCMTWWCRASTRR